MEDSEICHITSVYALNCSELISFMLAISEDRVDTEKKSERTKDYVCKKLEKINHQGIYLI